MVPSFTIGGGKADRYAVPTLGAYQVPIPAGGDEGDEGVVQEVAFHLEAIHYFYISLTTMKFPITSYNTSTISATTPTVPSSSAVRRIGWNSGLAGCRVIVMWLHVPSPSVARWLVYLFTV
jgi:hypothetical protein